MNDKKLREMSTEMAEILFEHEGVYVMNKEEIFQFLKERLEPEESVKETRQPLLLKVYIGDWSEDGHGKCYDFYLTSNYPLEVIQQAYKDTCRKIGLQLNHGEDFTGLLTANTNNDWRQIATEYGDCEIETSALKILVEHGCTLYSKPLTMESDPYMGKEDMFELFMWFVTYSMPEDFHYEKVEAEDINGFGNLNIQIGYGCFN